MYFSDLVIKVYEWKKNNFTHSWQEFTMSNMIQAYCIIVQVHIADHLLNALSPQSKTDKYVIVHSDYSGLADNEEKSDVQAIIESTPELDMDLGYKGAR